MPQLKTDKIEEIYLKGKPKTLLMIMAICTAKTPGQRNGRTFANH
jgi:hypothetical protein